MNRQEAYIIRRAAVLLGVPIPSEAARKYLVASPVRYWIPPGYEPTTKELVAARKLCRDSGREIPKWAQVEHPHQVRLRRAGDGR